MIHVQRVSLVKLAGPSVDLIVAEQAEGLVPSKRVCARPRTMSNFRGQNGDRSKCLSNITTYLVRYDPVIIG